MGFQLGDRLVDVPRVASAQAAVYDHHLFRTLREIVRTAVVDAQGGRGYYSILDFEGAGNGGGEAKGTHGCTNENTEMVKERSSATFVRLRDTTVGAAAENTNNQHPAKVCQKPTPASQTG